MNPTAIPVAILYDSGIMNTVKKAGTAISNWLNGILVKFEAISAPTMMSAGAVTSDVEGPIIGEKNTAERNSSAVTILANPVRAPAAPPAVDSTEDVVVDVPRIEPEIVATASESNARFARGSLLSLMKFAWEATPTRVPAVSKKSTNRKVSTTIRNCVLNNGEGSENASNAAPNVGSMLGTALTIPPGIGTRFNTTPARAVTIIPMNIAPGVVLAINITATSNPNAASSTPESCTGPRLTGVASSGAMIPAPCRPTKVMKNPIPALTAIFISIGMEFIMYSRKPETVKTTKIIPENKTPVNAVCQ